ncbi:hypothetical protein BSF38_05124 [Paludisphaera borealis]|uniref:Uncharacterized protein n=2 Tax=Paludisphaera borealis TaxID=1387353 RepID=A0A1U7CX75_9BACT|nr:hypothetical protein BSF38_05124 [Paludisphaera borealis]
MTPMNPIHQLDTLIDDLLNETDVSCSALASMLTAARDSMRDGYHVALALRVWEASNALKHQYLYAPPLAESTLLAESLD